jgi:hypothetical protein
MDAAPTGDWYVDYWSTGLGSWDYWPANNDRNQVRPNFCKHIAQWTVLLKPGNAGEGKGPDFWHAFEGGKVRWLVNLETPLKIRTLQRKLYCKAKAEPAFRFYLLYDKIYRADILFHAYRLARANRGTESRDIGEMSSFPP